MDSDGGLSVTYEPLQMPAEEFPRARVSGEPIAGSATGLGMTPGPRAQEWRPK